MLLVFCVLHVTFVDAVSRTERPIPRVSRQLKKQRQRVCGERSGARFHFTLLATILSIVQGGGGREGESPWSPSFRVKSKVNFGSCGQKPSAGLEVFRTIVIDRWNWH